MMDGVIVVDKPAGMTSHDVVDELRKRLGTKRVGHGGTLDPDATGVLVLGIGRATRFLSYAQASPKRYLARVVFGATTTTQDASGEVLETRSAEDLGPAEVEAVLEGFRGPLDQIPPMVSAVKVGGERLYAKARRGEEVEREPRKVVIYELALEGFEPGERAEANLDVRCSGGTYVRTLAHDLGAALGCGAHLKSLRRVEAGGFTLADARAIDAISAGDIMPLPEVVRDLPKLEVDADTARLVANGRPLPGLGTRADEITAVMHAGSFLGVYRKSGEDLRAERVVPV